MFRIHFVFCRQLDTVFRTSSSNKECRPWWRCTIETFWPPSGLSRFTFSSGPLYHFWLLENSVLFVFARQHALNASRIPCAHHLPWSPPREEATQQLTTWTRGVAGGGGAWGKRDKFWGLRSEFSRPEFTRHPSQAVVFLRFKNDSSSVQIYQALHISPCKTHALLNWPCKMHALLNSPCKMFGVF